MGDFDYPSVNLEMLETDTLGEEFIDLVNDCFLIQHVDTPTRDSSVLDLVFSSEDGMVENLHVKEHLGYSDHNIESLGTFHLTQQEEMLRSLCITTIKHFIILVMFL